MRNLTTLGVPTKENTFFLSGTDGERGKNTDLEGHVFHLRYGYPLVRFQPKMSVVGLILTRQGLFIRRILVSE